MNKKTFLSITIAILIVIVAFVLLICVSDKGLEGLLISLCEAVFTGCVVSIIPQLINWHSSESEFLQKQHVEFLRILEWAKDVDFQKQSVQEIKGAAYKHYQSLLRIKNQYIISVNMKYVNSVIEVLCNFINKIDDHDLALRILKKDLIPVLEERVEPKL